MLKFLEIYSPEEKPFAGQLNFKKARFGGGGGGGIGGAINRVTDSIGGVASGLTGSSPGIVNGSSSLVNNVLSGIGLSEIDFTQPFSPENLKTFGLLGLNPLLPLDLVNSLFNLMSSPLRGKSVFTKGSGVSGLQKEPNENYFYPTLEIYINSIQEEKKCFVLPKNLYEITNTKYNAPSAGELERTFYLYQRYTINNSLNNTTKSIDVSGENTLSNPLYILVPKKKNSSSVPIVNGYQYLNKSFTKTYSDDALSYNLCKEIGYKYVPTKWTDVRMPWGGHIHVPVSEPPVYGATKSFTSFGQYQQGFGYNITNLSSCSKLEDTFTRMEAILQYNDCSDILNKVYTFQQNNVAKIEISFQSIASVYFVIPDNENNILKVATNFNDLILSLTDMTNSKSLSSSMLNFKSMDELKLFMDTHTEYKTYDFCVGIPNSNLKMVFNDVEFSDNGGVINVSVCYLGENNCCDVEGQLIYDCLSLTFNITDPLLTYPLSCHGHKYVGNLEGGISTGGRSEYNSICEVETYILNKYKDSYVNTLDLSNDPVTDNSRRVLDLVYKFDGTTWLRQQNLIESVYYHTGVGNENNAIFWGGIHDSISPYSFSYNTNYFNDIMTSYTPNLTAWDCGNRTELYKDLSGFGKDFQNNFADSAIYSTPYWLNLQNTIDNIDKKPNQKYIDFLKYGRNTNFPEITLIGLSGSLEDGSVEFAKVPIYSTLDFNLSENGLSVVGELSGNETIWNGGSPLADVIDLSGNTTYSVSGNDFIVFRLYGYTPVYRNVISGPIYLKNIEINIDAASFVNPPDRDISQALTNEDKMLYINKILLNRNGGILSYTINHVFNYKDKNNDTKSYANLIDGTILFDGINEVWEQIKNRDSSAGISYCEIFTNTGYTSGGIQVQSPASMTFDIVDGSAVMVDVDTSELVWTSTLEECGDNITSFLGIDFTIGDEYNRRNWGTPIWTTSTDIGSTKFRYTLSYENSSEFSDQDIGTVTYKSNVISLSADSLSSILNNRVLVTGTTKQQIQFYDSLNSSSSVEGLYNINSVDFITNTASVTSASGSIFLDDTPSCYRTTPETACISGVYGTVTNNVSASPYNVVDISGSNFVLYFKKLSESTVKNEKLTSKHLIFGYKNPTFRTQIGVPSVGTISTSSMSISAVYGYPTGCNQFIDEITYSQNISGTITSITYPTSSWNIRDYIVVNSKNNYVLNGDTFTLIEYGIRNPLSWQISNISYVPAHADCYSQSNFVITNQNCITGSNFLSIASNISGYINNIAYDITGGLYNGTVPITSTSACCSGTIQYPNNLVLNNVQTYNNGLEVITVVSYNVSGSCVGYDNGTLNIILYSCPLNTVSYLTGWCETNTFEVNIQSCEKASTVPFSGTNLIFTTTTPSSGYAYSEWATSFIQEWRSDGRFNIPEEWVTSNDYNIYIENTGKLFKGSNWKRHMDNVGLGGEAPNYDTIVDAETLNVNPVYQWSSVGTWNVGQMSFGNTKQAVICGGHKVSRSVGDYGIGSGLHAPLTSKRIYIWDQTNISPEDSYSRNYLGRRFHEQTINTSNVIPISGCENKSNINCIIFNAESDVVVERIGSVFSDGINDTIEVVFDKPLPESVGTNYSISLTMSDNIEVTWSDKTVIGFKLTPEIKNWKGSIDYLISAVIKVTEDDLTKKGDTEGYIFDK